MATSESEMRFLDPKFVLEVSSKSIKSSSDLNVMIPVNAQ